MKIERSATVLTIKETPAGLWVFGVFFILVGGSFVFGALGGYSNYRSLSPLILGVHLLVGLIGVASGYWIVLSHLSPD